MRPLRFTLATSTAIALAGLGAGCGSTTRTVTTDPVILDTERVERAIEASVRAQRGQQVRVTCPPSVVQTRGNTFVCIATTRRGPTPFTVRQTDDGGHVTYAAR